MSCTYKVFVAVVTLIVFGAAAPAVSADVCTPVVGNLVVNCGFEIADETGDHLKGWTQSGNTGTTGVDGIHPHSGSFGMFSGPEGSLGFISQNILTVPGGSYNVSFYLNNLDSHSTNQFQFNWGGATQLNLVNAAANNNYVLFTFSLLALGDSTQLQFAFRHDLDVWELDDVVVTQAPVPEPTTLLLLGTGLIGVAAKVGRRRQE